MEFKIRTKNKILSNIYEQIGQIKKYESLVQAFVPGTFNSSSILKDYENSNSKSELFGLLLGIKDIINVDRYATHCGSNLPGKLFLKKQASCVTRLLDAGAIVAGKTVTSEFAISDPGPTRNPRNLSHSPGGSSSGSAAAVAAGFCDIALGTQTSGSVIRPAGYCGVIGFKPSFGRVALDGVLPYSKSMDHIGLFAKDISTLALTLPILICDWKNIKTDSNKKLVVGLPVGSYLDLAKPHVRAQLDESLKTLMDSGIDLKPLVLCENIHFHNKNHDLIANAELYKFHKHWSEKYWDLYKPASRKMLTFGKSISEQQLSRGLMQAQIMQKKIQQLMTDNLIDVWIAPVAPDLAPRGLSSTGDYSMNAFWSYAGLPCLSLPTGVNNLNLPYSVQIIGKHGHDEQVVKAAIYINSLIGITGITCDWDRTASDLLE